MNVGVVLIILLLSLSILGVPIFVSLGIATLTSLVLGDFSMMVLPQKLFTGMDSTSLLAIPFFILAGNLMAGGITKKLISFSNALLGHVRGNLGVVTVFSSAIFAAISGSGVATVSAIGGLMIPAMKEDGYDGPFSSALASSASILGPIIPPSIALIVYAQATDTSVSSLFMASATPGIGLALLYVFYTLFYARKHNFPVKQRATAKEVGRTTLDSIWALLMPVIILGGIFSGIFTATEAAAVVVVYALIIGMFVYKDIKPNFLPGLFADAAITTATILMLIGFSKASSWVIVTSQLPQNIMSFFSAATNSKYVIFIFINLLLLIVGMLMEANAAIVMLTPLLIPLLKAFGIDAVHFGIVMAFNLCVGLLTPPVGACILLGNSIAKERLSSTLKASVPFLILSLVWLMVISYVPQISLWLPNILN